MKSVLLVIAFEDYQPFEYSEPKRILETAGHKVFTVSDEFGMARSDNEEFSVKVDIKIDDVDIEKYDGLFFIGGPGALVHLDNQNSYKLLKKWQTTGKPYGAICISPRILAKAGVLQNKKATGWDGDNKLADIFLGNNVEYIKEPVVVDGNIVTANGPEAASEFGQAILQVL